MAAELSIHGVIGIQWKGPRRLPGNRTAWVADLVIYTGDDKRPHEVTLFASSPTALVPMRPVEVEHAG